MLDSYALFQSDILRSKAFCLKDLLHNFTIQAVFSHLLQQKQAASQHLTFLSEGCIVIFGCTSLFIGRGTMYHSELCVFNKCSSFDCMGLPAHTVALHTCEQNQASISKQIS